MHTASAKWRKMADKKYESKTEINQCSCSPRVTGREEWGGKDQNEARAKLSVGISWVDHCDVGEREREEQRVSYRGGA